MMRILRMKTLALAGAALLCFPAAAGAQETSPRDMDVDLVNDAGKDMGKVAIRSMAEGVLITVEASGLAPGWHGLHVHAVGNCSDHAAHFKQAGSHLAKEDEKHGYLNAEGPHMGDLPNIWVHVDGTAKAEFFSRDLKMQDLMDQDGSAFMIHEAADDYKTDPSGASGERLACGVINTPSKERP